MHLPHALTSVTMLDDICQECVKTGLRVNLLKLDFDTNMVSESMAEVLPYEDNTSGHFCVACDEGY